MSSMGGASVSRSSVGQLNPADGRPFGAVSHVCSHVLGVRYLCGNFDFAFEDLAGRALGKSVGKPHKPRVLVGSNASLDEVAELGGSRGGA